MLLLIIYTQGVPIYILLLITHGLILAKYLFLWLESMLEILIVRVMLLVASICRQRVIQTLVDHHGVVDIGELCANTLSHQSMALIVREVLRALLAEGLVVLKSEIGVEGLLLGFLEILLPELLLQLGLLLHWL